MFFFNVSRPQNLRAKMIYFEIINTSETISDEDSVNTILRSKKNSSIYKALEFANYRITLNHQLAALKAKTDSLLSYSITGGTFTIDRELITFCKALLDAKEKEAVLLAIYANPIQVDLKDFYDEILSRYFEVTNDGFTLNANRTPIEKNDLPEIVNSFKTNSLSLLVIPML